MWYQTHAKDSSKQVQWLCVCRVQQYEGTLGGSAIVHYDQLGQITKTSSPDHLNELERHCEIVKMAQE